MLISQDFILINLPKTGSSFSRNVIKQVHHKIKWDLFYRLKPKSKKFKLEELLLPNIRAEYKVFEKDQHGTFSQIPKELLNSGREIISVIRDPIEAYLSRYYFKSYKWVAKNNEEYQKLLAQEMPEFPDISFNTYFYSFSPLYVKIGLSKMGLNFDYKKIGMLSFQFIQFFSYDPKKCLMEIESKGIPNLNLDQHFPSIKFIFNENLSNSLLNLFKAYGYEKKHYSFIESKKRVNVTARDKDKSELLSVELLNDLLEKEALLYRFFPNYKEALDLLLKEFS